MVSKRLHILLFTLLGALAFAGWRIDASIAQATKFDLHFITFTQAGFPEQDAFNEAANAPTGQVMRSEGDQAKDPATLGKPVYASTSAVAHDPFQLGANPLGPFPKGAALNFNLQQWLTATGSGSYTSDGDNAALDLSFQKLVANATYSVWCVRLSFPPDYREVYTPCGAADGSQNVFKSDAQGNGTFSVKLQALAVSNLSGDFPVTIEVGGVVQSISADQLVLADGTTIKLNPGSKLASAAQPGQTVTLNATFVNDHLVEATDAGNA